MGEVVPHSCDRHQAGAGSCSGNRIGCSCRHHSKVDGNAPRVAPLQFRPVSRVEVDGRARPRGRQSCAFWSSSAAPPTVMPAMPQMTTGIWSGPERCGYRYRWRAAPQLSLRIRDDGTALAGKACKTMAAITGLITGAPQAGRGRLTAISLVRRTMSRLGRPWPTLRAGFCRPGPLPGHLRWQRLGSASIIRLWKSSWEQFTPFLAFPPEISDPFRPGCPSLSDHRLTHTKCLDPLSGQVLT
jgi:hypothetical protein